MPSSDVYIEKDASINAHIEQMRLSATKALLERSYVIIIATVSAIYGLGDPVSYLKMMLHVDQLTELNEQQYLVEAQRLEQRTRFDIEMIMELGYCSGIENYSRYLSGREAGKPPPCLLDYLPDNALLVIDESHVTIPQIGAMYKGDRSRKENLVNYGFRLPSALDNRPL